MRNLMMLLLAAVLTASLWAQTTTNKPLTNSDVESMLASVLPESTILLTIETAARRGLVDLDASPAALNALKQKGATEQVLNAVLFIEPFGAALKRKREEDRAVPDLPGRAGVYFKTPSGWVNVGSFLLWTPFFSASGWYHRSRDSSIVLGSAHSGLQISEPRPAFYVREPASSAPWQLVRLSTRKDQRLVRLASSGDFGQTLRTEPNEFRNVQMMHVAGEIYAVRPTADLEAGEYILCTTVPGGPGLNHCYGFGIQR